MEQIQTTKLNEIFTLGEIEMAFRAEFHKSGEIFFNYLGSEEECENSTSYYWECLKERLGEKKKP